MAHPHHQKMKQYAEDAAYQSDPWRFWQYRFPNGYWHDLDTNPTWCEHVFFRRKPKKWEPKGGKFEVENELYGADFHRDDARYADELHSLLRRVARLHAWRCENGKLGTCRVIKRDGVWKVVGNGLGTAPTDVGMSVNTAERCAEALNNGTLDLDG